MAGPGGPLNLAQAVASAAGALVLPALPQPVPVGAHVVVCGAIWRATDPGPIVVTDSRGTTYTVRPTATQAWSSGLSRGFLAHGRVTSAGSLRRDDHAGRRGQLPLGRRRRGGARRAGVARGCAQ